MNNGYFLKSLNKDDRLIMSESWQHDKDFFIIMCIINELFFIYICNELEMEIVFLGRK